MGEAECREGPEPPRGPWTASELEMLLDVLPTALYRAPAETPLRRLFVGGAIESIIGPGAARFRHDAADWSAFVHEEDLRGVRSELDALSAVPSMSFEYRVRADTGDEIWLRDRIIGVRHEGGDLDYFLGLLVDITREKREEGTFEEVVEQAPCGMVLIDRDGTIQLCNRELERTFGYEEGELTGRSVEVLYPAAQREEEVAHRARVLGKRKLSREERQPRELAGLHRDGRELPIEVVMSAIDTPVGVRVLASVIDNTERKRAREQLERANLELQRVARVDELTGLANRRRFEEQLESEWLRSRRAGTKLSLLLFDVDRFKSYNDSAGHLAGDEALRAVAEVAEQTVQRAGDVCARYGGEEFAVLLPDTDITAARSIAERIRARLESLRIPHPGLGANRVLTISVGVASVMPDAASKPHALLEAADRQLYVAKNGGRNRVAYEQLRTAAVQGRAARSTAEESSS